MTARGSTCRRSEGRREAGVCQSLLQNIFPATWWRARARPRSRCSLSAPAGKGRGRDKNKYSFQRRARTRCCVAWRRHLQEEICQPESNDRVDISRRGSRLAGSHPDLLNQVLPANVDLHGGSTKLLQYSTSIVMYRDLPRSQRVCPHHVRGPVSQITLWCCHQSPNGDQAGCSTHGAEAGRASTCLQPCRAFSCPTIPTAVLLPLSPTGSKAKTSTQISTGPTHSKRAPPGPSAMVLCPGWKAH